MKNLILLTFLFIFSYSQCFAQTQANKKLIHIETTNGNEFIGEKINEDSLKIRILTEELGEITIQKKDIKTQNEVAIEKIKDGKFWFENPQATRYFWSPNGFGLNPEEGYYQNIWLFWNQFAYGITNNFSLGAGIVPLFMLGGGPTPVWVTPKISIPIEKDKFNIGAGALVGTVFGEEGTSFGILYGLSTFGSRDNNISLGFGYGFADGELSSSPIFNINGMTRINDKGYLMTENYIITADGNTAVIMLLGGRWIPKKVALDFGLVIPIGSGLGELIILPWLGLSIPFGNID